MRGSKDAALSYALRAFVNTRLGALGNITSLSLNTAERTAAMRVTLRGDPRPVKVTVREYALEQADGSDWLVLVDAVASPEWVHAALRQFAVGRRIAISPHAARALRLLT